MSTGPPRDDNNRIVRHLRWVMAEGVLRAAGHVLAWLHWPDRGGGVASVHTERAAEARRRLVRR